MSSSAEIDLVINSVNDAPTLDEISDINFNENGTTQIILSGSDIDQDDLTFNISGGLEITATLVGDTVEFSAPNNFNGSETFIVTVSDGVLQDTQSFSVTVNAVNDAPVAATGISGLTDEDQSIVISLSATDIDGDNLTYSLGNDGLNGSVLINGTLATYTPSANFNGSDSFTFIVSDGTLTDEAEVTLTINAVNDAPVLSTIQDLEFNEDESDSITLSGSDIDQDDLTFNISGGLEITATLVGDTVEFSAPNNFNGSETFIVTVSDGVLQDTQSFSVTVNAVNDAPVAATGISGLTDEDQSIVISLSATDIDGDNLTYSLGNDGLNGSVLINGTLATYTPSANFNGSDSFTFIVSDGTLTDEAEVTLTINAVNDTPVFLTESLLDVDENSDYFFEISVDDVDNENGELSLSISNNPDWLSLDGFNLVGTPGDNDVGTSYIFLDLSDGLLNTVCLLYTSPSPRD